MDVGTIAQLVSWPSAKTEKANTSWELTLKTHTMYDWDVGGGISHFTRERLQEILLRVKMKGLTSSLRYVKGEVT